MEKPYDQAKNYLISISLLSLNRWIYELFFLTKISTSAELEERTIAEIKTILAGMKKATTVVYRTVQSQDTGNPLSTTNLFAKVSELRVQFKH